MSNTPGFQQQPGARGAAFTTSCFGYLCLSGAWYPLDKPHGARVPHRAAPWWSQTGKVPLQHTNLVCFLFSLLSVLSSETNTVLNTVLLLFRLFPLFLLSFFFFLFFKEGIFTFLSLLMPVNLQPNVFTANTLLTYNLWAFPWLAAEAFKLPGLLFWITP